MWCYRRMLKISWKGRITNGAFHAKSTNFRIKSDMTISDLDEIWWVCSWPWKKIIPKISDFWVKCGPKYGSTKFCQNAMTRTGQSFVSQLLWDLQSPFLYPLKGIWKIYLGKYSRILNNNKHKPKKQIQTYKPWPLKNLFFYFFYFLYIDWPHHSLQSVKKLEWLFA